MPQASQRQWCIVKMNNVKHVYIKADLEGVMCTHTELMLVTAASLRRAYVHRDNPKTADRLWFIGEETKDAFPHVTMGQAFPADWLGSQKKKWKWWCWTHRRLTSITEPVLACRAEQQLTFTQESCQCFLQTCITQPHIARVKRASLTTWCDLLDYKQCLLCGPLPQKLPFHFPILFCSHYTVPL